MNFGEYVKNIGKVIVNNPGSWSARSWSAPVTETVTRGALGNAWAAVRGVGLAPLNGIGALASAPVRATRGLWNLKVGANGTPMGKYGLLAAALPAGAMAGYGILKSYFGNSPEDKTSPPELEQMAQQQQAVLAQQQATQQVLNDMQAQLAMQAQAQQRFVPSDLVAAPPAGIRETEHQGQGLRRAAAAEMASPEAIATHASRVEAGRIAQPSANVVPSV